MKSALSVKWHHNFNEFCEKKRNVHRFWKAIAINIVDFSLERNLIVDFKNREFLEYRADNFAQVSIFEI